MKSYKIPNRGTLDQRAVEEDGVWRVVTRADEQPYLDRAVYLRHMSEAGGGARGGVATRSPVLDIAWNEEFRQKYGYAMESPEEIAFMNQRGYKGPSLVAWIDFRKHKYGAANVNEFQERQRYAELKYQFKLAKLNDRDYRKLRTDGGKRL